jgi:hypothetical protein
VQIAPQEILASLAKHLDAMGGHVYTETDQELFYDDLVCMVKIYTALAQTQAKSVRPKLLKIFESFKLKSGQAFEVATKHAVNAMIALGRQAAGLSVALDVTALIKEAQEACKDQAVRHHFNMALFRNRLRDSSLDETALQAVADFGGLKAKSDKFEMLMAFVDGLPQFCATLAEVMTKKSPEATQTLMQTMVRLKSSAEGTAAIAELRPHVIHLEETCGIRDSARAIYAATLRDFKETVSSIIEAGLKAFRGEGASDVRVLRERVDSIGTAVYTLKQHAAFSDTPHHDREAIDLTHTVLPICYHAGVVRDLKSKVPDNFVLGTEVVEALSALLADLENSKPKMQWMLGTELADKFLSMATDASAILRPIKEKDVEAAMRRASKAIAGLRNLLIDDSAAVSDDAFFEKFTAQKMEKIRKQRAEAKTVVQEARQRHQVCRIPLPEELVSGEAAVDTARRQIVKYGCLALARSTDANTDTEAGKALRKNLKSVWDTHCTDDDMVAYLGSSLVESIKAVLACVSELGGGVKQQGQLPGSKRSKAAAATADAQSEPGLAKKRVRVK